MLCKVIDGLFDDIYIHQLDALIRDIPLCSNNIANRSTWPFGQEGTHRLLGQILFDRKSINRITVLHESVSTFFDVFEMIEDKLQTKFYLSQISLNVQHTGCDGTTHCDSNNPNDFTIMIMTNSKWEQSWGGQFQLTSNDGSVVIEEHEYKPGRLIVIPSTHPHRGLGPTEKYIYRSTVVFRVTPRMVKSTEKNFWEGA